MTPKRPGDERTVLLLGREVAYRLRASPRARAMRVRVGDGGVEVTLPGRQRARYEPRADDFLRENAAWVLHQCDRARQRRAEDAALFALRPGHLLLRGAATPVALLPRPGRRRHQVESVGGRVVLWRGDSPDAPARALELWLRREARRDLAARVAHHAAGVAKPPGRLFVRDQRTRWGSCASSGALSFSWRLVSAPPAVLDYVAAHEVAHLDVPNHSRAFWHKVEALCGDYEPHRAWLRRHGGVLMRDAGEALRL